MSTQTKSIDNSEDVIDIRDVTDRVEYLESLPEPEEDDQLELSLLVELLTDLKGNGGDHDWRNDWYPLLLVRESYWEDFAQEEAESLGLINQNSSWPHNCIDWERAARELLIDYTSTEFDGVTYYYR